MKFRNLLIAGVMAMAASGVAFADGARLFARHEVTDYAAWRKAFDAFGPTQKKLGVRHSMVYQSADNANDVTVVHDFANVEKARAFAASPELRATMEKAGVKGAPQVWITTKAAK